MNDPLAPAAVLAKQAQTPFPGASGAYNAARQALLVEEIEFRRHMTRLCEQRRALPPGPVIEKNYRFKDEQAFEVGLIDLFGDKDTLVTYFWMYGPQRERPCPMCTNWLGAVNGNAAEHMNIPLNAAQMASRGSKELGYTEMKGSWFIFDTYRAHEDWCRWRAPSWHFTRITDSHSHANYHLGFRCCKSLQ